MEYQLSFWFFCDSGFFMLSYPLRASSWLLWPLTESLWTHKPHASGLLISLSVDYHTRSPTVCAHRVKLLVAIFLYVPFNSFMSLWWPYLIVLFIFVFLTFFPLNIIYIAILYLTVLIFEVLGVWGGDLNMYLLFFLTHNHGGFLLWLLISNCKLMFTWS